MGAILQPHVLGIKQAVIAVDTTTVVMARLASQLHIWMYLLVSSSSHYYSHSTTTTTHFSVATISLSGLSELLGLAGVLAVDVTTPLTGTLAIAVDSLPGNDTELAVVQKHGMTTAHRIEQCFVIQHVLFLQARW